VKVWKESSPGSGVWSVEATLTGHSNPVLCVAVLADGRLATGSEDNTVKVWG
jgi:WD40 repeat protein